MDHRHIDDGGTKQHAQRRDHPPRPHPYWVYDDDDWEEMRSLPSGFLICPEPGCRVEFQVPRSNDRGTRWLARRSENVNCRHHASRPAGGGGPMSAKHRWIQTRIVRILQTMDIEAIPEHAPTNSDVYVPTARLSIEIQQWNTKFGDRVAARLEAGASQVLWLLPEPDIAPPEQRQGSKGARALERALFQHPAARLRVHHIDDRTRRLQPWADSQQNRDARLSVYATVTRLDRGDDGCSLKTGLHGLPSVLRDIVDGDRVWCPPGSDGLPRKGGAWVLRNDLVAVTEFRRPQREAHRPPRSPRPAAPTHVPGNPTPPTPPAPRQAPRQPGRVHLPPGARTTPALQAHPPPMHTATHPRTTVPPRWWQQLRRWLIGQ